MLIVELRMVVLFLACNLIIFKLVLFFIGATPNHIPLVYKCPSKKVIELGLFTLMACNIF